MVAWGLWRSGVGKPASTVPTKYDVIPTPADNISGPIISPKGDPPANYNIDHALAQSRLGFNPAYVRTEGNIVLKAA